MTSCHEFYLGINNHCKEIVNRSFMDENQGLHSQNHAFTTDLNEWIEVLKNRPEIELYDMAFREYQYGLIAVSQGLYRHAFNSLRFFIEHTLAGVYFSFREMDLRLWMLGQQDIYWSNITDENNGIFSSNYFHAFAPLLINESSFFWQLAKNIYRECSEFTHGNYITRKILPGGLEYNENIFRDFHDKAETARLLIVFSLSARYLNFLDVDSKGRLESNIMEHIGHMSSIQDTFQVSKGAVVSG
jgi:hypothetical protein